MKIGKNSSAVSKARNAAVAPAPATSLKGLKLTVAKLDEFEGCPLLNFEPHKDKYAFKLGARKLGLIVAAIDDVVAFLNAQPPAPAPRKGKFNRS